ncbi:MAG: hypothetical protein QXZ44_05515 [Ferroplasma sp.]
MVILLAIQFVLGIYINLYVVFPPLNTVMHAHAFPSNYIAVMFHMLIGFLMLIVSFIMLLLGARIRNGILIASSSIAFVFVLVAGISGIMFLFNEYSIYSFLMSISFMIVVVAEFSYMYQLSVLNHKGAI